MVKNSFNVRSYIKLLNYAMKNGYVISSVREVRKQINKPILMLRHDIDLDLSAGLSMAKIEAEMGVKSTYFILLFNNFYNPLSPDGRKKVLEIHKLGHEIGLHWDERDYQGDSSKIKRNIMLLEEVIDKKILSASQHEPVETSVLKLGKNIRFEAYRDFKDFTYISDSSMKWRSITPWDVIEKKKNMHLLIHPFWWVIKGNSLKEKFSNFKISRQSTDRNLIDNYKKKTEDFLKIRDQLDITHKKKIIHYS